MIMFLLFLAIFPYRVLAQWPYEFEFVRVGDVSLDVYVVCLDGVDAHGVGDVSEIIDGVHRAARIPLHSAEQPEEGIIWFRSGFSPNPIFTYYGVKVNVSVTVVRNWSLYREVVEEGSNSIVVNAHGETLLVPAGYAKEDWVDQIASAMAERNMTWVHTAWHPFYYYQPEGGLEEEWGEAGFKRLMSRMGKDNITCLTRWGNHGEKTKTPLTFETILKVWYGLSNAIDVQLGRPLKASDFKNYTVMPIWGYTAAYLTGAVIKFAEAYNATSSFGFYVHVGTNQTFDCNGNPTPRCDMLRGYAGTAAAIWTVSLRKVAEKSILEAQEAVDKAVNDGRTEGLDEALDLLQQAEAFFSGENDFHQQHLYDSAVVLARMVKESAEKATEPSPTGTYGLQITVIGTTTAAAAVAGTIIIIIRKRNSKKKTEDI
jgi:hypothetical protein